MKYIELLIGMGDVYFRQDTLESIPLATQMYIEASHVFGLQPVKVPQLGKQAAKTYEQLGSLNAISNATIDMKLEFLFYVEPGKHGRVSQIEVPQQRLPSNYIKSGYFCEAKACHMGAPIDYSALQGAQAKGDGVAGILSDLDSPMPRYQFSYIIRQALELAKELKRTGQKLLSFKEKKDAEALSALRLSHQNSILDLTVRIMENRKAEIERAVDVQEEERSWMEMRLDYFLTLTVDKKVPVMGGDTNEQIPMSPYEKLEIELASTAADYTFASSVVKAKADLALAIPMITKKCQPMGIGEDTVTGGTQVGQAMVSVFDALDRAAHGFTAGSAQAARLGAASRSLQERRLKANICR
ncbi:hypothetical protein BDW59DRAFT_157157 [Aspergillus cavernicola]|uniref:Uncharacterized protein n=1 Tax=Aspergillus cavernicola TaxID=176166 RepID=A0ABR4IZ10_9EURO